MINYLIINTLLSITGLYIAAYIWHHKKEEKKLMCMPHHNCEAVIYSSFGKIFGIDTSLLGILFYGVMLAAQPLLLFKNIFIFSRPLNFYFMVYGIFGALFSWFLVCMMQFVIKERCSWCLGSFGVANLLAIALICNYLS